MGDEVVQLYVSDEARSVSPPVKELKGFQRVRLEPGQSQEVSFGLSKDNLSFIGLDLRRVFESGWLSFAIGCDSLAEPQLRLHLE